MPPIPGLYPSGCVYASLGCVPWWVCLPRVCTMVGMPPYVSNLVYMPPYVSNLVYMPPWVYITVGMPPWVYITVGMPPCVCISRVMPPCVCISRVMPPGCVHRWVCLPGVYNGGYASLCSLCRTAPRGALTPFPVSLLVDSSSPVCISQVLHF